MNPLSDRDRARALRLVSELVACPVSVVGEEPLGSDWAPVTRFTLDYPVSPSGDTVIVKTRRAVGGDWGAGRHVERERAGLQLVRGLGIGPDVLAADEALGVLVLSDLTGPTLEDALLGPDPSLASNGFVAFGELLGHLHAATARTLPPDDAERYGPWPGVERWHQVVQLTRELRFPDAGQAGTDIGWLCAQLRDPAAFLAFNHADPTPNNVILTADGARLIDFEGSGFRHVGCEAAALHFPFPHYSAHWAVLPQGVIDAADNAYRQRLVAGIPAADDDKAYRRMLAIGCGAELAVRVQRLAKLAADDQTPAESWRRRTQLLQQIDVFVRVADSAKVLLPLADWFAALATAMRDRWEDAGSPPPPIFPAFS